MVKAKGKSKPTDSGSVEKPLRTKSASTELSGGSTVQSAERVPSLEEEISDIDEPAIKEYRTITITLEYLQDILPVFTLSDVKVEVTFMDTTLGETDPIPVTDDRTLNFQGPHVLSKSLESPGEVDEKSENNGISQVSFTFKVDINSAKDMDQLVSNPIVLTVIQISRKVDMSLMENFTISEDFKEETPSSIESAISMYEAITGEKVEIDSSTEKESKHKKVKEKKIKGDKGDKKKKSKEKSTKEPKQSLSKSSSSKSKPPKKLKKEQTTDMDDENFEESVVSGICVLDLLPMVLGRKEYKETLPITPLEKFKDDRMISCKMHPSLVVSASVDAIITFRTKPKILSITLESIYNIPAIMKANMDYTFCMMVPQWNSPKEPILLARPLHTSKIQNEQMKCWPNLQRAGGNTNLLTKYKITFDQKDIKNKVGEDVFYSLKSEKARLQFNCLKRNLLFLESFRSLKDQVRKYHKIAAEIYMKPVTDSHKSQVEGLTEQKTSHPYLHLMTFIDITELFYPGVTKVRVACPVRTFQEHEALELAGLDDSYFCPKPRQTTTSEVVEDVKEKKGKGKKDKSPKKKEKKEKKEKSSKNSSKKSKSTRTSEKVDPKDLKRHLPPPPVKLPPPEPSALVYNEDGDPCFVIIEIELSVPLNMKMDLQNLEENLQDLIQMRTPLEKIVLSSYLCREYYQETLNKLTTNMRVMYRSFLAEKGVCSCDSQADFITYLRRTGVYQSYLHTMTTAISLVVTNKFKFTDTAKNTAKYKTFISEIFSYLLAEMHTYLNKQLCTGLEPIEFGPLKSLDCILLYAQEACELGKIELAERYYMERLSWDDKNPDFWFDYAVHKMQQLEKGVALQCVQEALSKKMDHHKSLMLFGILLADEDRKEEAETCFLTLMVNESVWLEGWGVLYLFYEKYKNYEGMAMAEEMLRKYTRDPRQPIDYFATAENLAWTYSICSNNGFLRTAVLLLKMRAYEWAENALANVVTKYSGVVNYLFAVISYYKKDYKHALEHLSEAEDLHGSDYAVLSLKGHCYFAIGDYEEARKMYYHILESFTKPDDMHLLYINCSKCLEEMNEIREARKLILLACKYNPTPYTWMIAGILYFKENDLLSAEECFSESNMRDNRCAEVWGYLTLINLCLQRKCESELCFRQVVRNGLQDLCLFEKIVEESKKLKFSI